MDYVTFQDVCKYYHMGDQTIAASDHVTFQIKQGEFCIIVGPSGAGKTTVLNILGGMDSCDEGLVSLDGRRVSDMNEKQLTDYRRHDVGFVFQFYNLVQNLTALENVELASEICREPLDPEEVMDSVGLSARKDNFPAQLSGGEQQRVALARALVNKPTVLLADEPTGNLDPKNSWEIMKLLEQINENGTTVLVVTHNREIVNAMQKRVITLKKGVIVSDEERGGYIDED